MAKKKKSATSSAASSSASAGTLYDLGPPYGKVLGFDDDPWSAAGRDVVVPGSFWPDESAAEQKKSWKCRVAARQPEFPFAKGTAIAYYIEHDDYYYPMPAPMLGKFLPKGFIPDYTDSADEELSEEDEAGDEDEQPKKTRKTGGGRKKAAAELEYDDTRPAAGVADEINELITRLHSIKGGKDDEDAVELEGAKKKAARYKTPPTGWKSTAAQMVSALLGISCALPDTPTLKDPRAQGITRLSAQTWRMVDSFNLVYPIAMRDEVAAQTRDYWAYQHELGAQGVTPKGYEHLWPVGGITRAHYDAYIAVVAAMGIVRLPKINDYWCTNTGRFLVPFVRTTMTRDFFFMIRHYLHFADARKKVLRGDRSLPPPAGYDPIYNFRPMMNGFNTAWSSLVTLCKYTTIDEKMIKLAMHIGLSRRQPNKPICDGLQVRRGACLLLPSCVPLCVPLSLSLTCSSPLQVYVLSASKGDWVYYTWIDQGEGDPNLKPPYHFGKTVAIILYLLVGAGALGTWCTIVMDQYFTSPTLLLVLTYLKVFCIGTCQTNRRGWPATQIAETEASIGKVSKPGDVVFKHEVGSQGAIKWAMTALKWFDKNQVHIATNCTADETEEYLMKKKGEVDALETEQPTARKLYCQHKVGVDVVDQTDASNINDHGSKKNPWIRPHDAYVNTAMNLAFDHYAMVIEEYGDEKQERKLKRLRVDAHEARWELLEQLTENAKFGVERPVISSQVSNLRRGGGRGKPREEAEGEEGEEGGDEDEPEPATPAPRRSGRARQTVQPEADEEASEEEPEAPRTRVEMPKQRSAACCDFQMSVMQGKCGMEGCNAKIRTGCKAHGLRLCFGKCLSKHVNGEGKSKLLRAEIEWQCDVCDSE